MDFEPVLKNYFCSPIEDIKSPEEDPSICGLIERIVIECVESQARPAKSMTYHNSNTKLIKGPLIMTFGAYHHTTPNWVYELILCYMSARTRHTPSLEYNLSRFRFVQIMDMFPMKPTVIKNVHELERFSVVSDTYPVTVKMRAINIDNQDDYASYEKIFTVVNSDPVLFSEDILPCPENSFTLETSNLCFIKIHGIRIDKRMAPDAGYFSYVKHYTSYGFRPA